MKANHIEAMKLALEALDCIYSPLHVREINKVGAAMAALREALAEQPCVACEGNPQHPNSPCAVCGCKADQPAQQEPVAWAHKHINATLAAFGPGEPISMTKETWAKLREAMSVLIEQPAQRCPLCNYQHGHAIGCKNNPVDIALDKMAENARELGLDYEPSAGTQVSKVWWDGEKMMEKQVPLEDFYKPAQQGQAAWTLLLTGENQGLVGKAGEKFVGAPEYYERVDVYTSPQRQARSADTWVGLTFGQFHNILQKHKDIGSAMGAVEKTLREQNT